MTDGRYRRPAHVLATVLVVMVTLMGPAQAAPDNAHFAQTFRIFCARMMADLAPIHQFAAQQRLRSQGRTPQSQLDHNESRNFRRWVLPHEGRQYLLAVDRLPHPENAAGHLNVCMLQSASADVGGVAQRLKTEFRGKLFEIESSPAYGPGSRSFIVKGFSNVGMLTLILRRSPDHLLSLTAIRIVE